VGIDIGPEWVRAAVVAGRGGAARLEGVGAAPAPKGDGERLPEAVRRACLAAGVGGGAAAACLPRGETTSRLVRLPAAKSEQVEQMLVFEAGQQVPFPAEEVVFGYRSRPQEPEAAEGEHLLLAARQGAWVSLRRTLAAAGLRPTWCAAQGVALAGLADGPTVVVQVEGSWTGIDLVQGELRLSRTTPVGGQHLGGEGPEALAAGERLAGEIERLLLACEGLEAAPALLLVGPGASQPLAHRLGNDLGLACRVWSSGPPALSGVAAGPEYALAVATAMQAVTAPATLNLHAPQAAASTNRRRGLLLVGLVALALLVVALSWARRAADPGQAAQAARLRGQVQVMRTRAGELAVRQRELQGRLGASEFAVVMRELTTRAPAGVWLTSLSCGRGGTGSARGKALSSEKVGALVAALGESPALREPNLTFVRQMKVGSVSVVEFGLTWQPEGGR